MKRIIRSPGDVVSVIECARVKQNISKRGMSKAANVSTMTYTAFLNRGSGGSVANALGYLAALGFEVVVRTKE